MNWKAQRPRIEIAVEWIAASAFGAAMAFALFRLGAVGLMVAGASGVAAAASALFVLALVDRDSGTARPGFAPVDLPLAGEGEDELLLDDPLPSPGESRVVRLFTSLPEAGADGAIPAPGEMLARIETFLGTGRGSAVEPAPPANHVSVEASVALHAALADIRASLRRG